MRLSVERRPAAQALNHAFPRHLRYLRSRPDVMLVLVVSGTAGLISATWWAEKMASISHGAWSFAFVSGLVVAVVPLSLMSVGFRQERPSFDRLGTALFAWALMTQPYMSWAFRDKHLASVYAQEARGYLPGLGVGLLLGVSGLVVLGWIRPTRG
jgi:hypothetical protein